MKRFLRLPARTFALLLTLVAACWGEKSVLVVQVNDSQNRPVAGIEISAKGTSESGVTDRKGLARLKLDPQVKVNDSVILQILTSPPSKDFVLISPWDARTRVPPFDRETVNFVTVVVADRGDRAMLENGKVLASLAAKINKTGRLKVIREKNAEQQQTIRKINVEQQRREALEAVARTYGLIPTDIDSAIRAWGEKANDPYEKGVVALYEKNYPLANQKLKESFDARKKAFADAAFFLGQSEFEQGKYRESMISFQEAKRLRPDDAAVLNNLAVSMQMAGDYAEAEPLLRQALAIDEKVGPNSPDVARDLSDLGSLLYTKGDYKQAEPLFRQALALAERALGPNHATVATILNNLAELLRTKGNYREAEPLYRRILDIDQKALGPDHPDVARAENNLAILLSAKEDSQAEEAEILFRRALDADKKILGPNHPHVAEDLNNLASLLYNKRDYPQAEALFRQALQIDEKALGPNHPTVATFLNNLGEVLRSQKNYSEAEPLYRRALKIDEKALGPVHPGVATDLNNLAFLLQEKGDYSGAEPLFRQALAIDEKALGPNHPETEETRHNLEKLLATKQKAGTQ